MVDTRPFLPVSNASSYTPLSDHASQTTSSSGDPADRRRIWPFLLSVLLALGLCVALIGYHLESSDSTVVPAKDDDVDDYDPCLLAASGRPHTLRPLSRGPAAGVSEKSSRFFADLRSANDVECFPWNNSLLSWQRTAFHFQPEKNWMNGNEMLSFFFFLFSFPFSFLSPDRIFNEGSSFPPVWN